MKTSCRHFNGITNECCKAGINYKALTGSVIGYGAHIPCIPDGRLRKDPIATCDKISMLTPEELAAEEKEIGDRSKLLITAIKSIRATKKQRGSIVCPKCAGDLNFSIASNGHIWGKCLTEGCLTWMM